MAIISEIGQVSGAVNVDPRLASMFHVTMTGDLTVNVLTSFGPSVAPLADGATFMVAVDSSVVGHTLSWNTIQFNGGSAPSAPAVGHVLYIEFTMFEGNVVEKSRTLT